MCITSVSVCNALLDLMTKTKSMALCQKSRLRVKGVQGLGKVRV